MAIEMQEPAIVPQAVSRRVLVPRWLAWENLRRLPLLPIIIIGLFVFISIFGEWLAPRLFNEQNLRLRFLPPAWLEGGSVQLSSRHR